MKEKSTDLIFEFMKKLEKLTGPEQFELENELNDLVHFKTESDIYKLLEESKSKLGLDEQLMLEKIVQSQSAKILVTTKNNKNMFYYSLKFIPVGVLFAQEPKEYSSKIPKKFDLNPIFKKRKFLHRHSEIIMMNNFVSQKQLEQISYRHISKYLKNYVEEKGDPLETVFDIKFEHEYGESLYIPLIFIEPLNVESFEMISFSIDANFMQLALDEMADHMAEDGQFQLYPYPIYDPYECLEMSLGHIFVDMCNQVIRDMQDRHIPMDELYVIKSSLKLIFSAVDKSGDEIINCSLDFPVNSVCVSTMEAFKSYLLEENIGKLVEDSPNKIKMKYIGNFH